jgi:hypothetical protein
LHKTEAAAADTSPLPENTNPTTEKTTWSFTPLRSVYEEPRKQTKPQKKKD